MDQCPNLYSRGESLMPCILITILLMIKEKVSNFDHDEFVRKIEELKTLVELIILLIQLYKILHGKEKKMIAFLQGNNALVLFST